MASSSSSEDQPEKIYLSNLLTKTRDDLLENLEKYLIEEVLPVWDRKSNSKLQNWIENTSSRLDVSLSINILKLMTCYVMNQAAFYDGDVVMEIYLNMLSMSSRVAECDSTERYTKISFWESITEFNMALLDYNDELISKESQVIGLQFISIVVTHGADHFLRQLYIKSLNNLLEKYPSLARTTFKQNAQEYLECLPACLAEVGDYDFQTSIVELIFRTTGIQERKANVNKIFPGLDLTIQSLFLRIQDFDPDCRQFLNKYNGSQGDNQLVFTFPCHNAQIGQLKLSKPKSSSYEKFWVDFNLRSGTILIMCDRSINADSDNKSTESTWESIVLYPNEVTSVQLSCLPHTTTLVVELGRDPSEIFASPPLEEDLALLSEWISIEFSPNNNLKTVCRKLYKDKIIVHDVIPSSSYRKVSKTEVAIPSKAFSSSEAENNSKPRKSSAKHHKMSKTKVPIPAMMEDSSSGNQLWNSSAVEHITTTTKDVPKKVPRKTKISKTCVPIKCASQSESNTATSGVTDEDQKHPNKETEYLFQNVSPSKMEIEASTSKENVNFPSKQSNVSKTINSGKKHTKSELETIAKDAGKINITEEARTQENIFNKCIEIDGYKTRKVSEYKNKESKIEKSPLKIKDTAKKVANDAGNGCTTEVAHTQENIFTKCSDMDDYKGKGKKIIEKKKEESKIETSPLKIKDSAKKVGDISKRIAKKGQLEKRDSTKTDTTFESHTTKDKDDKLMTDTEKSIIDETEIIEKEFDSNTENIDNLNMFINDTTLAYPQTPSRNEYDKRGKSPIIGGNSLNKLSEIISSASPEKRLSTCLSLEAESEYAMPTQDQGILLEAMDTLDNTDINKDLSSTEVKIQNSEDEVDVDIESEEEIPSSIATPSATTPLFKLKKNTELFIYKNNIEEKCEKIKANEQKEVGNESSITSKNLHLSVRDESNNKNESKSDGKSRISFKKTEDEKSSKTLQKMKNRNLIGKGGCNRKDVKDGKTNDKATPKKSDDEKCSKMKTSQKINDTIKEKCISQNKVDNQHSENVSSGSYQQEESNIDLDEDVFTMSEGIPDFIQTDDNILPSKGKEISPGDSCTPTEKLFEIIEDINLPLKSLKSVSLSHDNKSSSPKKAVNISPVNYNKKNDQEYLRSPSKSPKPGLSAKNDNTGSPSKVVNESHFKNNVEYEQEDMSSVTKSPKCWSASRNKECEPPVKSVNISPMQDTDIQEQENMRLLCKSPKFDSPVKKYKSEPPLKAVNTSSIKDNEQDRSQVFKHSLRSRKCKSSLKEPAIKSPVKEFDRLSNMGNTPQGRKFKDFSSLISPKSTKKNLLIKSKSSSKEPAIKSPSKEPAIKSPSKEPAIKSPPKELAIKSPVKGFNKLSNISNSPQGRKFKDFSSLISSPKSTKKKNLLIKTQPTTRSSRASYVLLSVITSPKQVKNSYKAVVKVIESPKMIVEITKSPIVEITKSPNIIKSNEVIKRTESNSDSILLEKSVREDTDIMHVTSSVLSPTKEDLVDREQHIKNPNSVNDGTFHDDNILIKDNLTAEIENYYVGIVQSSYSGKEAVLRYSKEITVLDQITKSDRVEPRKIKKRGLFDDDLIVHGEEMDSSQPKAKSPRKEDDKLKETDKNMSEGLKSTMKILETYASNVLENKISRKTPRKDEITPVHGNKAEIKNESNKTKNKRNKSSPAINVTPNVTPNITTSNRHSEMKKSKKKLFNNSDLNILQDTPPSSQSPDVDVSSLYKLFNSETKSSRKHNSSKVNVSNDSSVKYTKDLSVHSTFLESPTHFSDEEMFNSLESNKSTSLKQDSNKPRKSIRMKKENLEKKSTGRNGPMRSVKGNRGRPKKISNVADSRVKKNRFLASPKIDSPVSKEKINTFLIHSIYSDFSSEDDFGWLKKKESESRIKVSQGYGKPNWSYRRSTNSSSPEWRPVREKRHKKRAELPKAPTPPKSYHSTSSVCSNSTDSEVDDIFKHVTPKKKASAENNSGQRITRSFLQRSLNSEKKQEISSKDKHLKRKRLKESSIPKNVASWCSSISRPESPEILRQNSCSSVESQTPGRDFKLAPGRGLEGIKLDISNNFGFSSPEMAPIPEEPVQKRIRKSVDDADIKGLLEGILPKSKDVCRNTNMSNNMSDTGVYPLAPNNTPVSPVLAQKEESNIKENNSYMTDASDKDETGGTFSPRQSTMIDDLASKTLPSLPQFSYVAEQLEESFIVDKTIGFSGIDREDSLQLSPLLKSPFNTRLQLSVEDSPQYTGFLLPSQPWTPPQGEDSDTENEIHHEDILVEVHVDNLKQTRGVKEAKTALVTSSDEDRRQNSATPDLFSLETTVPLDNAGTQAFSLQETGEKLIKPNTSSEHSSLQSNQSLNKNKHFSKEELVEYKEKVCNILVNQENICNTNVSEGKTQTAQLLNKVLDSYEKSENFEGASQLTPTSHQNRLETPEVSQRRLFLNMDEIDISGLDSTSPITPTRRRILLQQMEEFRTHITVSYNRSVSLWENVMKIIGEKNN